MESRDSHQPGHCVSTYVLLTILMSAHLARLKVSINCSDWAHGLDICFAPTDRMLLKIKPTRRNYSLTWNPNYGEGQEYLTCAKILGNRKE
jgi:hypothetical protein